MIAEARMEGSQVTETTKQVRERDEERSEGAWKRGLIALALAFSAGYVLHALTVNRRLMNRLVDARTRVKELERQD
jgi:hypothetical protein